MTTARDAILKRIRTELATGPPVAPPPLPEVWPCTDPSTEQLIERFTGELQAVQGEVLRCRSMDEAKHKLAELAAQSEWKVIGAADRPALRDVAAELPSEQVAWPAEAWQPRQMAQLSAGLVEACWLLADTGSCAVVNHTARQRLLCYLPPACVVLASSDRLFEHMPAAWQQIAAATADPAQRGEFVLITGPSRTADIEKILILGVHGPKRLIVLLVD